MICTTCNRPAERGYLHIGRNEQCCDPCHGPHLTQISNQASRFIAFHGKRAARKHMSAPREFEPVDRSIELLGA